VDPMRPTAKELVRRVPLRSARPEMTGGGVHRVGHLVSFGRQVLGARPRQEPNRKRITALNQPRPFRCESTRGMKLTNSWTPRGDRDPPNTGAHARPSSCWPPPLPGAVKSAQSHHGRLRPGLAHQVAVRNQAFPSMPIPQTMFTRPARVPGQAGAPCPSYTVETCRNLEIIDCLPHRDRRSSSRGNPATCVWRVTLEAFGLGSMSLRSQPRRLVYRLTSCKSSVLLCPLTSCRSKDRRLASAVSVNVYTFGDGSTLTRSPFAVAGEVASGPCNPCPGASLLVPASRDSPNAFSYPHFRRASSSTSSRGASPKMPSPSPWPWTHPNCEAVDAVLAFDGHGDCPSMVSVAQACPPCRNAEPAAHLERYVCNRENPNAASG